MIGGIVIESCVVPAGDKVYINCADRQRPKETCAIHVEISDESLRIEPGDAIWWQGDTAFWTTQGVRDGAKGKSDISLKRVGYSGVRHPSCAMEDSPIAE